MIPQKSPYEAFGIACGPGWKSLYEPLIWYCQAKGIPVTQVKEKFGRLRFYIGGTEDPHVRTLISALEDRSKRTCEDCGEDGVHEWVQQADGSYRPMHKATTGPSRTSGWIRTLCAECRDTWDQSREARTGGLS